MNNMYDPVDQTGVTIDGLDIGKVVEEIRTQGYTVFRQILPLSLVGDLRRVSDAARDIPRRARGAPAGGSAGGGRAGGAIDACYRCKRRDFRHGGRRRGTAAGLLRGCWCFKCPGTLFRTRSFINRSHDFNFTCAIACPASW